MGLRFAKHCSLGQMASEAPPLRAANAGVVEHRSMNKDIDRTNDMVPDLGCTWVAVL